MEEVEHSVMNPLKTRAQLVNAIPQVIRLWSPKLMSQILQPLETREAFDPSFRWDFVEPFNERRYSALSFLKENDLNVGHPSSAVCSHYCEQMSRPLCEVDRWVTIWVKTASQKAKIAQMESLRLALIFNLFNAVIIKTEWTGIAERRVKIPRPARAVRVRFRLPPRPSFHTVTIACSGSWPTPSGPLGDDLGKTASSRRTAVLRFSPLR
jgi:hypothetical protein